MATVNVDYSEFETLKSRVKELEETLKEKNETIASLKNGSRVIIRKEVQVEYANFESPFSRINRGGTNGSLAYGEEEKKPRRTFETSESYVGFEDVRLKVEERMKDEINLSIKRRDAARENYDSAAQNYERKKREVDDEEKKLKDEYAKKEESLVSEYKKKSEALETEYKDKGKAYKQELDAKYDMYIKKAGRLFTISDSAKEALSLLNANRFFKPKGVENILTAIIQKCEG